MSRKKPNIKNRIEAHIEERVVSFAIEHPAFGQTRASNELKKEGMFISPCGVRCVWLRHDLETFQKRLKALESKVAQEGLIITESQVAALEKAKEEKVSSRGDRDPSSRLSRRSGHLLCRPYQRCRQDLPANLYRHLFQSSYRQTV